MELGHWVTGSMGHLGHHNVTQFHLWWLVLTRGGICVPPTVTYLPYRVSGSTLTAVGLELTPGFYPGSNEQHRQF